MEYSSAMTAIKAEDAILAIQTNNYRAFKKTAQKKIIRRLKSKAHGLIKRYVGNVPSYAEVMKSIRSQIDGR